MKSECTTEPHLLIVEDDELFARSIERILTRYAPVMRASSSFQGFEYLSSYKTTLGVILDIKLPDGSGLDLAEIIRTARPEIPILILSGYCCKTYVNRAYRLKASYLCKTGNIVNDLKQFAERAVNRRTDSKITLEGYMRRVSLTRAERQVLFLWSCGKSRKQMAIELKLTESAVKARVRSLLRKCGVKRLSAINNIVAAAQQD